MLNVGQVIDESWEQYSSSFIYFIKISAWMLITAVFQLAAVLVYPIESQVWDLRAILGFVLVILSNLIIAPAISIWVSNMLIKAIAEPTEKYANKFKELSDFSWRMFFPHLWVIVLTSIAVILAGAIWLIPGAVLSIGANNSSLKLLSMILITAGTIIAILVMLKFSISLFFSSFFVLLEKKKGVDALKSSIALVRGRWWKTFWRLIVPFLLVYFAAYIMHVVIINVLGLAFAGLQITSVRVIAAEFVTVIFLPITTIIGYRVFEGLKKNS